MDKKILILEDEKEVAQMYAKRLKEKGYDPELAHNGFEGLEKLKEFNPGLILLDLNMPRMGGLEFYEHICDARGMPKYPVLVLTGRADLEMLFKDFHVDGFLTKPFDSARLLKEVEIILNKQCWKRTDGSARQVTIVDDQQRAENILSVFSKAGYKTDIAKSGVSGIEKIIADPPDLAMVNLSLSDIAGDVVILRLQQIARTKRINSLLYVQKNNEHNKAIMERFSCKRGVRLMLEYTDSAELLNAAAQVFQGLDREN